MFWVNIRQAKGGDGRHVVFALTRRKLSIFFPLPSHLILTEATAITICHPFDSFCHQLAAKSAFLQTKMKQFICLMNHYLALVWAGFLIPSFTLENRRLQCSWRLAGPLRSPGSVLRRRRPLWAGNKPHLPLSGSLSGEFLPLAPQNLQGIDKPFNEAHQAVCQLSPW